MSKKLIMFCVGLAVLALAMPVYAEVQNIKVSGDISAYALYRNNYDLVHETMSSDGGGAGARYADDEDAILASVVRLRVDADLTDNVAACVALANLREWDTSAGATQANDITLDLAYVTLKEMLYSPLTVIIGRQNLMYGNGMIVGAGLYQDPQNAFSYDDLSPMHGYDAVRAILDYDPWTIDVVMAKMEESDDDANNPTTNATRSEDVDLYGLNIGYKFDDYQAEVEGYYFVKIDDSWDYRVSTYNASGILTGQPDVESRSFERNEVYTLGARGSLVPMDNLTLAGEFAYQFGEIIDDAYQAADIIQAGSDLHLTRDREAMLAHVKGSYDFVDVMLEPSLSVEYLYTSGEETTGVAGDYEEWDTMYRGYIQADIRDCLETLFVTYDPYDTSGFTNSHVVKVGSTADFREYIDGLKAELAWMHFWFAEEPLPGTDEDAGDEIDLTLTYDYTEDVQFAVAGAVFIPGEYYDHPRVTGEDGYEGGLAANDVGDYADLPANDPAYSIIGSCKVTF